MSTVAFIPARGGSERIPGKNIRMLAGHPLIAYAIAGAKHSGIFNGIYVSTESGEIADVANMYGAEIIFRLEEFARSDSPDIQFVKHLISSLRMKSDDTFIILRPTNPFRTAQTIKRAWREWAMGQPSDSMRAVSHVRQHPYKMWKIGAKRWMLPMSDKRIEGTPVHDMPTQELPLMLIQNGCIHIARAEIVRTFGDYTGETVLPFYTELNEGFDLNIEEDWILAETLICKGIAKTEPMGD